MNDNQDYERKLKLDAAVKKPRQKQSFRLDFMGPVRLARVPPLLHEPITRIGVLVFLRCGIFDDGLRLCKLDARDLLHLRFRYHALVAHRCFQNQSMD